MGKGKNNIQSASSTGYDDDDERSLSRLMLDENSWGPLSTSRKVSLSSRSARIELRDKLYVGFIKRKKKGSNGARLIYFLLAPIPPAGWQLLTGEGKVCTDRIRLSALCWAGKNQRALVQCCAGIEASHTKRTQTFIIRVMYTQSSMARCSVPFMMSQWTSS